MEKEEDLKKVRAIKQGDVLYVAAGKSHFILAYVYYLLEYHECNKVAFGMSLKEYKKEDLKGKEDWKDV